MKPHSPAESPLAPYAAPLSEYSVNLSAMERRFPANLEKKNMAEPEGEIFSVRRRLRKFFEADPQLQEPFRNILGYIKRTRKKVVTIQDLLPEQYFTNGTVRRHLCRNDATDDVECQRIISGFSGIMVETGIAYPFIEDLHHHPDDAMTLARLASAWAMHEKDVPKLRIEHTMARFIAKEIIGHPELFPAAS